MFNITLIVLAVLIPSFFLLGFRWGVRFGATKGEEAVKVAKEPLIKTDSKKKPVETDAMRKRRIEMQNIENYTSPWSPQEDIK